MNYPIWNLPNTGGGLLIAIIAIVHVLVSHLAVGGGLFLVLTERKAIKSNDQGLLGYVKSHTKFFLLLTMVFGGITGVGIWFIIALVHPAATSILIHNFVFAWAIEWVFFLGEIVALLIYHYRFSKMNSDDHMKIGWLYFIFAWGSLFIINGILGFMLTPGNWLETGNMWDGFFNPSFWPSLIFRSCISFIMAGIFGLVTASFTKNPDIRKKAFQTCVKWMYLPVILLFISGFWYSNIISSDSHENLFQFNASGITSVKFLLIFSILLFILGLWTLFRLSPTIQKVGSFIMIFIALGWMGSFEYSREIARKPFVLYDVMYSTGVTPEQIPEVNEQGILKYAKWSSIKEINEDNLVEAGKEVFRLECMACHTIGGYNQVKNKTKRLTERGILAHLSGQGKVNNYMPQFLGTDKEKEALAAYIARDIHGLVPAINEDIEIVQEDIEMPEFDMDKSEYVLLVWNDLGMHCISDNDPYFVFLPPANTLNAQLFKRGPKPHIITEGVKLLYEVQDGYKNPQNHVDFWNYDDKIFGIDLPIGQGLKGKMVKGEMDAMEGHFVAELIPVVPYRDDNTFNPFPVFSITAFDVSSGEQLISTKAVAPTSTELGCRNCHGGGWRVGNMAGLADETAENILWAHDKYNGTELLNDALAGKPMLCQSCHADPALGAPGKPDVLNLSSAIHGFHANYLGGLYNEACNMCHPSRENGRTNCMRGRHSASGLTCVECHGNIEDHSLSLLKDRVSGGNQAAKRLSAKLQPSAVGSIDEVQPRIPWLNEPDCKSCHYNFDIWEDGYSGTAYNKWVPGFDALYRNRTDNQGVMCIACHGATHAVYPATNLYGEYRDNIQPMQYQGVEGTIGTENHCIVCHTIKMPYSGHHRNMLVK